MMTEEELVRVITAEVVARIRAGAGIHQRRLVPVNISARHLHLGPVDVEALFGPGHQLTRLKDLMQPGQFACHETVAVIGPKGSFPKVRVLGPARGATQLEVSLTDARTLGLEVPLRLSGDIEGSPGITLEGPKGRVALQQGVIVAVRHIHLAPADAERFGVRHGQRVRVRAGARRPVIFEEVVIRVSDRFVPEMHIDTDEANAGAIRDGDLVEILSDQHTG